MKLILGGRKQGKLAYVLAQNQIDRNDVCDGKACTLEEIPHTAVMNHLHLLIQRLMKAEKDPYEWIRQVYEKNHNIIWITDEIGCGIVPMNRFEREWRETTGRICCDLAQRSELVERVFCGIPVVLKG